MSNGTTLMHRIMLAFTKAGARIFRNQVGEGWYGDVTFNGKGPIFGHPIVTIKYPRKLTAGLCVGSSDLIGWLSVEISPDMVGKRLAVFVAAEVKTERDRITKEQSHFLAAVKDAGGIAIEARDVDGAVDALRGALDIDATGT